MKKKDAECILQGIYEQGFNSFIFKSEDEELDEIKDSKFRNLRMNYTRAHNDLLSYLLESAKQPIDKSKLIQVPTPKDDLIKYFKPVFDEFPTLNYLPLFITGGINDGTECQGESYSISIEDYLDHQDNDFLFVNQFKYRMHRTSNNEYKTVYDNIMAQDTEKLSDCLDKLLPKSDLDDLMDNKFFDWMRDGMTSFIAFIKRSPETSEISMDFLEVDDL